MDERLRALEQRWLETKSLEDEAAWIAESIRAGVLDAKRVALAGKFGHEAAAAFGDAQFGFDYSTEWEEWATGVIEAASEAGFDPRLVLVRVALPTAETYFRGTVYDPASGTVQAMFRALLRFVWRPNVVTESKLPTLLDSYVESEGGDWVGLAEGDLVFQIFRIATETNPGDLEECAWGFHWDVERAQDGIRELVAWLLDRGDPIADRLAALKSSQ